MLVAMVISLSAMQGIAAKQQEVNLQQVGLGAAFMSERRNCAVWGYVATWCSNVSQGAAVAGVAASALSKTNPVGWKFWAGVGVVAL